MKLKLPFYIHKVGAGFPSPATDYIEDDVDLNTHLIKNAPATFIIRVQGKSMTNVGIYDGDILIVDRSLNPKSGKIVIAAIDGQLTVKRLSKTSKGLYLKAENDQYQAIKINDASDVVIWGVVTSVIHKV